MLPSLGVLQGPSQHRTELVCLPRPKGVLGLLRIKANFPGPRLVCLKKLPELESSKSLLPPQACLSSPPAASSSAYRVISIEPL